MRFSEEVAELRQTTDAKTARRNAWMITILLLVLTSFLAFSELLHNEQVSRLENYAIAINLAGRQRMLTQRIAYLSEVMVTSPSYAVRLNTAFELKTAAEEMYTQREILLELVPLQPTLVRLYQEAPVRLYQRVDDYITAAGVLSEADVRTVQGNNSQYQLIAAATSRLLTDLEAVVTAYQQQLSAAVGQVGETNRGRIIFVIGGLASIGFLIVFPTARALNRYVNTLYVRITALNQNITLANERQAFTEAMLTSLPSPLAVYDIPTGKTVYMNERYRELLGYTEADGMVSALYNLESLVHVDDLERAQGCMIKAAETGQATLGEYRLQRKDGVYIMVESRAASLRLQGKVLNPPQLVALIRQIDSISTKP